MIIGKRKVPKPPRNSQEEVKPVPTAIPSNFWDNIAPIVTQLGGGALPFLIPPTNRSTIAPVPAPGRIIPIKKIPMPAAVTAIGAAAHLLGRNFHIFFRDVIILCSSIQLTIKFYIS